MLADMLVRRRKHIKENVSQARVNIEYQGKAFDKDTEADGTN